MLRKLFPCGFSNSRCISFRINLVAERYLAIETARFIGDYVDRLEALQRANATTTRGQALTATTTVITMLLAV